MTGTFQNCRWPGRDRLDKQIRHNKARFRVPLAKDGGIVSPCTLLPNIGRDLRFMFFGYLIRPHAYHLQACACYQRWRMCQYLQIERAFRFQEAAASFVILGNKEASSLRIS